MNQNAPCRLCGKHAKLLKKSHVIPDFMYKGISDELNRMAFADLNSFDSKPKIQQSGYYEKYILCAKCDNVLIGELERYTALLLFDGRSTKVPIFNNLISLYETESIIINNIDYKSFKLCLLSILWRAHISRHKFFKKIDIGDNENKIREMLLTDDPKTDSDFKISIVAVSNNSGLIRMVLDPSVLKFDDDSLAFFFINGIFYFINLTPHSGFDLFQNHHLKQDETCEIMLLNGQVRRDFMLAFGLSGNVVNYYFS
jgi:hypothetical protein